MEGGKKATKKLLLLAGGLVAWKNTAELLQKRCTKNINSKAQNFPRFGYMLYNLILYLSMVKALAHFCFLPGTFQSTSNMSPVWRQLSSLFLLSSPPAMFQMALFPSPLFAPMDMMAWGGRRKKLVTPRLLCYPRGGKENWGERCFCNPFILQMMPCDQLHIIFLTKISILAHLIFFGQWFFLPRKQEIPGKILHHLLLLLFLSLTFSRP